MRDGGNESKRIKTQPIIWIINQKNNRNHSFNVGKSAVSEERVDTEIVLNILKKKKDRKFQEIKGVF